jgi:hypothetical protein
MHTVNVRFWLKPDVLSGLANVCFWEISGHRADPPEFLFLTRSGPPSTCRKWQSYALLART